MAVLVLACASAPYDRMIDAIRRTWGSRRLPGIDVYYLYGRPEAGPPHEALSRHLGGAVPTVADGDIHEAGQVLIAGCADSIETQQDCLLRKRLIAFGHLTEQGRYQAIYTVCATSYVDLDRLRGYVASTPPRRAVSGPVGVDTTGTSPYVSGASMLLTADIARELAEHREDILEHNRFGSRDDVALAHWVVTRLSTVPLPQFINDVRVVRSLGREHVLFWTEASSVDYVTVSADDQRPTSDAHHYHFHSTRPEDMESFHARFFGDRCA